MTDNTKKIVIEWAKLPAMLVALGAVLFFLGNGVFASDADLAAVTKRVTALESVTAQIARQVNLVACLHLADVEKKSWEPCVQEFGQ